MRSEHFTLTIIAAFAVSTNSWVALSRNTAIVPLCVSRLLLSKLLKREVSVISISFYFRIQTGKERVVCQIVSDTSLSIVTHDSRFDLPCAVLVFKSPSY